jgi:hypothetical protein
VRCGYCGAHTHTLANCPKTWGGQGNRNAMRCGYCGSKTHNTSACTKTHRGPLTKEDEDDYVLD